MILNQQTVTYNTYMLNVHMVIFIKSLLLKTIYPLQYIKSCLIFLLKINCLLYFVCLNSDFAMFFFIVIMLYLIIPEYRCLNQGRGN